MAAPPADLKPPAKPAVASVSTPAATQSPRRWLDELPLAHKLAFLVVFAATGGILVAFIEMKLGHRGWPALLLLAALIAGLVELSRRWITAPLRELLSMADRAILVERPSPLTGLPTQRRDEIGHLARIIESLSHGAVRDYHDAKQLRRTLDQRVEQATQQATRQLQQMAMRDAMTDLGNRRFLEESLPALFESCRCSGTDLVCLAIDVDHFKQINDTLGHSAGDDLIKFIANLIRGSIRHGDYAIRLGGDEFLILMPGCPLPRVKQFADQIIALFRQHARASIKADPKPDLSMGVASVNRDRIEKPAELLERADANLYHAKRAGKGRVAGI